jgi:hypothetical protein
MRKEKSLADLLLYIGTLYANPGWGGGLEMSVDPLGSPSCSITFYYATCRRPYFLIFFFTKKLRTAKSILSISFFFFSWLPCVCTILYT